VIPEHKVVRANELYMEGAPLAEVLEALGLPPSALATPEFDDPRAGLDTIDDLDLLRVLLGQRVLSMADLPGYAMLANDVDPAPLPPGCDGDGDDDGEGVHERHGRG
jgi:hypothetical protein